MPEISRFFGIIISMYYNDHPPPHFHTRYSGQKGIIEIRSLRLLEGRFSPRIFGLVMEWAAQHQAELMDNWERGRQNLPLNNIEPLE